MVGRSPGKYLRHFTRIISQEKVFLLCWYTYTNYPVVNISSHLSNKYQCYYIFLVSKGEYGSFTLLVHPYPERKLLTKGQFYYIFLDLKVGGHMANYSTGTPIPVTVLEISTSQIPYPRRMLSTKSMFYYIFLLCSPGIPILATVL